MPPEQEQALAAVARRGTVPAAVDGRSDIYALGRLLYELLAGSPPSPGVPRRELRRLNPSVSVGLADILARCLAPDADKRYPSAAALAADLRRHLADLPLRGARNRSLAERCRKWLGRHRQALPALGLVVLVMAAAGVGLDHFARQADRARSALHEGQKYLTQQRYTEARDKLQSGVALLSGTPFDADVRRELHEAIRCAEQGQAVEELHLYAERVRPLYNAANLPEAQASEVQQHCRALWRERGRIPQRLGPQLTSEQEQQVRRDLLDLAILMENLAVRLAAPGNAAGARREALRTLEEAEALFGPSCVLYRERQDHAQALGLKDLADAAARQADQLPPRSAWEHVALGLIHFRAGDYQRAGTEMDKAVELDPSGLWPNYYRGSCAYRQEHYADAVTAFSVCVALSPRSAWCYLNRGLAQAALGRLDAALSDYDHALQLDATLAPAAFARAVACYQQNRHQAALEDLQRALELGTAPASVWYQRALVQLAQQDPAAARESLRCALRHEPNHEQAKQLLDRLR
jgi:tetratricopeptide (TPR) repeat protein